MDKQIVISIKTIFLTFLLILAGYLLIKLGPILALLLIATLIVFSMEPFIKKITSIKVFKKNISRNTAVIFSYVLVIGILAGIFTLVIPPVITQMQKMISSLPGLIRSLELEERFNVSLLDLMPVDALTGRKNVLSTTVSVFSNIASIFSIFVIAIYMSLDWVNLKNNLIDIFPSKIGVKIRNTIEEIQISIAHWLKGQLILMFVVGLFSFLGLWIMGVDYPLALGIISGLLEIVPIIGPFLSALIASIVGFATSPIKGIGVVILFIIIQQLENNLLVPKIMEKVSGFSPLIILIALLIGGEFFGIVGAILAIPMTMVLIIIVRRVLAYEENQ